MPLFIQIDSDGEKPIYQQISDQIKDQIRAGQLPLNTQLPPIRHLAETLGVTRNTIQTAYDELQADGWIEAYVGRGTYISRSAQLHDQIAAVGHNLTPTGVLHDMQKIYEIPVVRSLAYTTPDKSLFDYQAFGKYFASVMADVYTYNAPEGDVKLRIEISKLLKERGIPDAAPSDIIVTNGATQGLSLITQALTRPGDVVVLEDPAHMVLLHIFEAHQVRPLAVPMDDEGPDLEKLEQICIQRRPRFFCAIPNFHNPTGRLMSAERRRDLLKLAERHSLLIVEDDIYGVFSYDGPPLPALKSQDEKDLVIYVSSFDKTLMPGLRIGYMMPPRQMYQHLLQLKQAADLCTSPVLQRALAMFIKDEHYRNHLKRNIPIYKQRRDRLLDALKRYMPDDVHWTNPRGGYSCWLTLPDQIETAAVVHMAMRQGFAFTPGDVFLVNDQTATSHLRICFAGQTERYIEEAIHVLSQVIRDLR